jgi:hypothetical protein
MRCSNRRARPLLRGALIDLGPWRPVPGHPDLEHRTATIAVWCPHCRRHHTHGWDPADNGSVAEHRVAHCIDGPFRDSGYYISPLRRCDPGYLAHVIPPGRPIVRPIHRGALDCCGQRPPRRGPPGG